MDGVIGYTTLFAGNFEPYNWAYCQGQTIAIQRNTVLFSILGTTYGGNGTTNFKLPDLQGRAVIGAGQGPALSPYSLGDDGGTETMVITSAQIPLHTHPFAYKIAQDSATSATSAVTTNNAYGEDPSGSNTPFTTPANVGLKPFAGNLTMANAGTNTPAPISTINPYLALNYIICLAGSFPPRQ
ncbi:phage tail protein [Flavobacterium aquicola]|uniref:Microcystin-dependent protein n=1 Tax=Flavobacterium aquicola TaxID=1682742 RepID=A0A3E0DWJ8_9FLAO|nr:tail fiber protein [Flavobacterium aquicola]REG90477.1 microcystin-dependent protein [Flavobacterium aquicola]